MKVSNYWRFLVAKEQLADWMLMVLMTVAGGIGIYLCYPYPDTMADSFGYLRAAIDDTFFIYRPFGYSAFLQVIHVLSHSVVSILVSQLLVLLLAAAMLILAVKCYFPIRRIWLRLLLIGVMLLNPVALYMSNCIMSDTLFTAEIYLMLAMMTVIIMEQSWTAMVLFVAAFAASLFTRYSAVFFVVVFVPLILMVRHNPIRWTTLALIVVSVVGYYRTVKADMYEATHLHQFSTGFDGWQWANNGLHVVPFLEDEDLQPKAMPKNGRVKRLHEFCVRRFDDKLLECTEQGTKPTAAMIWSGEMPLKQYMFYYMQTNNTPYPIAWAKLGGSVYADYGKWLIKTYPLLFWKHYLAPNIKYIFVPTSMELVRTYKPIEAGQRELCEWYNVPKDQPLDCRYPLYEKHLNSVLPWAELVTWLLFILGVVLLGVGQYRQPTFSRAQWLLFAMVIGFGFILYGTTTFASPVVIRYWLPMQLLKFIPLWMYFSSRKA